MKMKKEVDNLDTNIKPSVITTISDMWNKIKETGLTDDMIIDLLKAKTRLGKRTIKTVVDAVIKLESEILENRARRNAESTNKLQEV